jgi:hypothetical protein
VPLTGRGFALSATLSHTGAVCAFIGKALNPGTGPATTWMPLGTPHRLTARSVIAVEVVSLLLIAVLARPGFVRAAPALTATTRVRLPSATAACCDRPHAKVSHLHTDNSASRRKRKLCQNQFSGSCDTPGGPDGQGRRG